MAGLFFAAIIPIIWLVIALMVIKMQGYAACISALALGGILAAVVWKFPLLSIAAACGEGALNGLWPICLIIVAAMYTYYLTIETGAMEKIKQMLASVSNDKRILILLIAWGLGGFLEGMAGFGTSVAIPAGMLTAIGLDPVVCIVACLIANAAPTPFASVGIPATTLANVAELNAVTVSGTITTQYLLLSLVTPFFMVALTGRGIKALKGMWIPTIVSAIAFTVPAWIVSVFLGPELPDIIGGLCCMVAVIAVSKKRKKPIPPEYQVLSDDAFTKTEKETVMRDVVMAWMPYILICICLLLTSNAVAPVHDAVSSVRSILQFSYGERTSSLAFYWIQAAGVIVFAAGTAGGILQGGRWHEIRRAFKSSVTSMFKTILTICSVLALAKIMSFSGMTSDIANMFVVAAGAYYPFFAPLIGAVGAFVTGSGTSASVLFGGLQMQTAKMLAISEKWLVAANMTGSCIGKMVCPQSISIGVGTVGMNGKESVILKKVIPYFILYIAAISLISYFGMRLFG